MKQFEKHTDTNNELFIKAFFSNGKKIKSNLRFSKRKLVK